MASGLNHYARLGIPGDADVEEIRQAYFEAARRYHPDANPIGNTADAFLQVQEAYDVLSHSGKRQQYNETLPAEIFQSPPVSLKFQGSRTRLERLPEDQIVYTLIDLSVTSPVDRQTAPSLNLCMVLDRSTSMQGERIDMVKANTVKLIEQMRPADILSIVSFSDFAEVLLPPTRVSELRHVTSRLNQLVPGGSTEIYRGLSLGFDQVFQNLDPSRINHLILLTDGRTYGDEADCLEIAEQAYHQGVGISIFGIGGEWNDVFLDRLANVAGGSSAYIAVPKDLQHFILEKYAHLGTIYAERVTLDMQSDPTVELRYAFRLQPETGELITGSPIRMGNLVQSNSMLVVLEFLVHPVPKSVDSISLGKGVLKFETPSRAIPNVRVKFDLRCPVLDEPVHERPPTSILKAISRLSLYRIQDRAREEVKTGA
ncbi:MAG TPA: VWA domain-containing protein, partial [Anaerolineaceae bacterium]|nr:VWA domain-containing protein [Anaerolineaceae bacterium]